jgi:DNA replication protein DnaC
MNQYIDMTRRLPLRLEKVCTEQGLTRQSSFTPVLDYLNRVGFYLGRRVGLCLSGPNGIGKTGALMVAVKRIRQIREGWMSREIMWTTARDIAREYEYGNLDNTFDDSVDTLLETAELLVIDELGRECDIKNFERRMLALLRKRVDNRKTTLIATNLSLSVEPNLPNIKNVYGEAYWSLLHEACLMVTVEGPDRRKGAA